MAGKKGSKWVNRKSNVKKPDIELHTDIYIHKQLKDHLNLVELKQLWQMYQADCSLRTIALYLGINSEYALECIEAAKWHYGGGLKEFRMAKTMEITHRMDKIEESIIHQLKPIFTRPKAIYSNKSPYGIASKGNKLSVSVTSLNAF